MSKLNKIKNGEYIGGDKYIITPESGGKSRVVFTPDSVITEATPVGAEILNEIQLNGTYTLNTNRIIDGQKEVYVATLEGFTEFSNPDLNLILKINSNNSSNNVYLRLNNIDYQILNCGIGNLISGRFINARKEGNFIRLLLLEKTDLVENDTNKVFSAKGAFDLKTWLVTNYTTLMNNIRDTLTNMINLKLPHGGYGGSGQQLKNDIDTKVSKSGDTMTGTLYTPNLISTRPNSGSILASSIPGFSDFIGTDVVAGGGYMYYVDPTNNKHYGFRTGRNGVRPSVLDGGIQYKLYHEGYKPTKADVGLDLVNNWDASSAVNDPSNSTYATAGAAKKAYDRGTEGINAANTKIPQSGSARCDVTMLTESWLNNQDGSAILFSTNFTGIYDRTSDIVAMGYRKSQGVMESSVPLEISLPQSDKRSPLRLKTGIDSINAIFGARGTASAWYVGNGLGNSNDVMLHDYVGGGMLRLGKDSISINKPLIIDGMYAYRNAIHSKGDFNSYTTNGRFWLAGDSLTANAPHANSGALTVDRYEGSTGPIILQTFEPYYSNSTYTRTYGAGVWSSWYERTAPSVNYYNSIKFQEIETIVGQDTTVVFPKAFPNKCLGVYVGMVSSVNPSTGAFYGGIECAQVYEVYNGSCMVAGYEILSGKIQYQNVKVKLLAVGY